MKRKQENPVKILLSWSGENKRYLFASITCAFISGLFVIGPYIGIYNLMGGILSVLASGDRDHILSGVFNQFLSEKSEPAE